MHSVLAEPAVTCETCRKVILPREDWVLQAKARIHVRCLAVGARRAWKKEQRLLAALLNERGSA